MCLAAQNSGRQASWFLNLQFYYVGSLWTNASAEGKRRLHSDGGGRVNHHHGAGDGGDDLGLYPNQPECDMEFDVAGGSITGG